jgi:hypothetical protein
MEGNPRMYNSSLHELLDELTVNMTSFHHRKVAMREQLTRRVLQIYPGMIIS